MFNMLFNNQPPVKIEVSRQSCVKSILLGSNIVFTLPDNVLVQYHGELYSPNLTFD